MSTDIRPEVSDKKEYWISKHRYYELKHFCMQLTEWKRERSLIDGYPKKAISYAKIFLGKKFSDPTEAAAVMREYYTQRIEMVERFAKETDPVIGRYILQGVVNDLSYDTMNARNRIPCSRDEYYRLYRKFFFELSKCRE